MGAIEYIEGISPFPILNSRFAITPPRTPLSGGHIMELPGNYRNDVRLFTLTGQEVKALERTGNAISLKADGYNTGWHLLYFKETGAYYSLLLTK
jgi:hypothetical protein